MSKLLFLRLLGRVVGLFSLAAVLGSGAVAPGWAQERARTRPCRASHQAAAGCRSFFLTEAAYGAQIAGRFVETFPPSDRHFGATVDAGGLVNLGRRVALGGTASVGLQGDLYIAVKPRARLWLSPTASFDLSVGPALTGRSGFVAEASIMARDRIGFAVQALPQETSLYDPATGQLRAIRKTALFAGLKLGSRPGLIGILADGAAVVLTAGAFIIACRGSRCYD